MDGFVAVPEFADGENGTGFNDRARHHGAEAVRAPIATVMAEETPDPLDGMIEQVTEDAGSPFTPAVLAALARLKERDRAAFEGTTSAA